ncbi:hypothetical protein KST10_03660 [Fusobacterium animalis]|jgi:hypothetical protein|uniref:Uncharacterized protein n=1 Tax=Fusobacterium animalis 7_1 TaxID=457405 RepID=A0A140PP91_9FUSO|nr:MULTISPECIES: hypothetical protein [Fusobacterium]AKC57513.1 hypothetical protein HMPREF1993_00020 [Fusobacterium phage Funu1]EEO42193.1 hypothetical protein FSDG_00752 [Fusobacterium animalis 7_1]EHG20163.2 hypothetical protein HMPREF9369_00231 [Fusobacterium polymorphum F0401]
MENNLYFKNETSKYIFFLVELKGKIQLDFLGIDPGHYSNKEKAKNWYNKIKNIIEKSEHSKVDEAIASLEKLYKGMAK